MIKAPRHSRRRLEAERFLREGLNLAAKRRGQVAYLLSAGVNGSEVAKRLGLSRQQVSKLRTKIGMRDAKSAQIRAIETRRGKLAALVATGTTNRAELQRHLRVTDDVLYRDIKVLGLQDRLRRPDRSTRRVRVSAWTQQGLNVSTQAKLAGVSPETIYEDLMRIGLHERGKRFKDMQSRRAQVAVWTAEGISVTAQATLAGVSTVTIYKDQWTLGLRKKGTRRLGRI